ncbi:MAG TPA: ABC transporter permease, partial [Candidatus Methylomirabilis sp.]
LIHCIPGDPVEVMLGETALAADKAALRHQLRLDLPLPAQYLAFLRGLARLDLGRSLFSPRPVWDAIRAALPATAELALAALAVALLVAVPLGTLAALKRDTPADRGAMFLALLGVSVPNFVLAPLLVLAFPITLGVLPVSGREGFASLVLPAATLGLGMAGILSRMVRSSLLEVLRQDFVTFALAKGLPRRRVVLLHALRPALIPVLTLVGLQLGGLLSGTVITETIFAWPGLGRLAFQAIQSRDYPLVQGCVLVIALTYVLVNLATDLLYALADPRVRYR